MERRKNDKFKTGKYSIKTTKGKPRTVTYAQDGIGTGNRLSSQKSDFRRKVYGDKYLVITM